MKYIKLLTVLLISITMFVSCGEDFMDIEYTNNIAYSDLAELIADDPGVIERNFLPGAWAHLVQFGVSGSTSHDDFSHMSVMHSTDLMGQDIALFRLHWFQWDYELDNRMENYRRTMVNWVTYYTTLSKANEVLDLCAAIDNPEVDLGGPLGHAYALRAFSYYYLIQLFQHPVTETGAVNYDAPGVPMYYSIIDEMTDEQRDAKKGRNTLREVYAQIESDLEKALVYMETYTRPNKNYMNLSVVQGLAARYYLLSQQWEKAADLAKKAQAGYTLNKELDKINDGFCDIENTEWMWGFDHTADTQTTFASFFSHASNLTPGYAGLGYSVRLIDKQLFESIPETDYRKKQFNAEADGSQPQSGAKRQYASLKFGWLDGWVMDYVYMRVPEMYLIEAEALAHMGKEADAAAALKPLMEARHEDGTEFPETMSVEDVYQQRRIELWGEGFTFFDLKRLNKGINRDYPGTNHWTGMRKVVEPRDDRWRYQIPLQEMQENKHLEDTDQNS